MSKTPFVPFGTHLLVGQWIYKVDDIINDQHKNRSILQLEPRVFTLGMNKYRELSLVPSEHSTTIDLHVADVTKYNYFDVSEVTDNCTTAPSVGETDNVHTIKIDELEESIKLKFTNKPSDAHRLDISCPINSHLSCHTTYSKSDRFLSIIHNSTGHDLTSDMLDPMGLVYFIYKLPPSKRHIKQVTDMLTRGVDGPNLPRVLAELIVSYLV